MNIIGFLECIFLGLIIIRLAYIRRSNSGKLHKMVSLMIWLAIVVGLMSIFSRINSEHGTSYFLDLMVFIMCFLFLYFPVIIDVKWRR